MYSFQLENIDYNGVRQRLDTDPTIIYIFTIPTEPLNKLKLTYVLLYLYMVYG